jgi:hypothetical protein
LEGSSAQPVIPADRAASIKMMPTILTVECLP